MFLAAIFYFQLFSRRIYAKNTISSSLKINFLAIDRSILKRGYFEAIRVACASEAIRLRNWLACNVKPSEEYLKLLDSYSFNRV